VSERLPSAPFGDIRFLHVKGGKVHVIDPHQPDRDVIGFVLGDTLTLCGRVISKHEGGHFDGHAEPIADFPDDWLCAHCWQATAPDERVRLFEHAAPTRSESPRGNETRNE
jgi:hypothetical protein